jgi:hypothetical protein
MTMQRLIAITASALLLVGVGVAVAHSDKSVKQVSATFTATDTSALRTSSCTGPDGTYVRAHATYSGSAVSSDASLNGAARIEATSLINTTTGDGVVTGKLRIDAGDKRAVAHFTAVYTNGAIAGLAEGHTASPGAALVGNLSAGYSTTGGFTDGKLGGGTSGGNAVAVTRGGCRPSSSSPKPERVEARGAISAVSSSSITVAGVTCSVPADLQEKVGKLHTSDVVTIHCEVANGTTTLTKVSGKRSHD